MGVTAGFVAWEHQSNLAVSVFLTSPNTKPANHFFCTTGTQRVQPGQHCILSGIHARFCCLPFLGSQEGLACVFLRLIFSVLQDHSCCLESWWAELKGWNPCSGGIVYTNVT